MSTRFIGAIVMAHGDDSGLVLPPRLAPIQVVIVPIYRSDEEKAAVLEVAGQVAASLKGLRVKLDDREQMTPGFKFNDWEMRGVPLRIEVGPRDVKSRQVVLARRDIPGREGKSFVPMDGLPEAAAAMLETIQQALYDRALAFREANTFRPENYEELCEAVGKGFAYAYWCGSSACEDRLKEDAKATTRNIPLDQPGGATAAGGAAAASGATAASGAGRCVVCGEEAREMALWARTY